ncbi:MAG: hypothetical protein GYB31_12865 [Bacteroidetes bacterium]|nr:hypothetical protein [Bacteroidota bacterium]
MRILGEIDHPRLKITVFKMDDKLSLKLEDGLFEQTYKFRKGEEGASNMQDMQRFCNPGFLRSAEAIFRAMRENRFERGLPKTDASANEFDEII